VITEAVDFFPFNLASGPAFLVFFGVLSLVVFVVVGFARDAVGRVLDKREEESVADTRLLVGRMPKIEDCLAVAYMREGERGVANTLISEGVAEGWLGPPTKEKKTFTFGGQRPRRAAARAFYNAIAAFKEGEVDASTWSWRQRGWCAAKRRRGRCA
jgi:hypothetical protein